MKKLHFNSTLNHKASDYKPYEICVERVVTLYGRSFEELKNHLMHDDPYIVAYRDLMYTEGDTAHCLLFVDYDSGDGVRRQQLRQKITVYHQRKSTAGEQ